MLVVDVWTHTHIKCSIVELALVVDFCLLGCAHNELSPVIDLGLYRGHILLMHSLSTDVTNTGEWSCCAGRRTDSEWRASEMAREYGMHSLQSVQWMAARCACS